MSGSMAGDEWHLGVDRRLEVWFVEGKLFFFLRKQNVDKVGRDE